VIFVICGIIPAGNNHKNKNMYDIIIRGGKVVDGSGNPSFAGDIGIKEDIIQEIGDLHNETARTVIELNGSIVAPGFVDVGNHSDTYLRIFQDPNLESLVYQGITTIIGGNCGASLAPLANKDVIASVQKYADVRNLNINWLKMGEFLAEVERIKLSVNFGSLVGHTTLRRGIIGDEVRGLTSAEMKTMKKMLEQALADGALGLSTGLVYTHAKIASEGEIMELAEVVKSKNGVYATHVRGESSDLIESVEEAVKIAQKTGVKLEISHLKAIGSKNWHLQDEAINFIETARMSGLDANFDVYPYTVTGSVFYILLPDWVVEGGRKMMIERLRDEDTRKKVILEMQESGINFGSIVISISPLDKKLTRRRVVDIARAQGKTSEETILDLFVASDGRLVTMMDVLSEKNMVKALHNPFSIISSNGAGYSVEHASSGELVHPRNFGSFPRVLANYVREKNKISWEEAIHKMSGRPAEKYGITKRGLLKKGYFADVVIFNPAEIQDLATPENPYQYSKGVEAVIVNGEIILENGNYNGKRVGRVIRKETKGWF
jgi:N-acyl-D-amino-acid deacylase